MPELRSGAHRNEISRRFVIVKVKFRLLAAVLVVGCLSVLPLFSQKSKEKPTSIPSPEVIARGKYLVEGVGLCSDCHTPRNEKGELVVEKQLMGAPVMFKPAVSMPWAEQAPRLAGLPGWSDEAAIKFLTTGETITGMQPRPPMPPYRFTSEDAAAVTAYLKSLKSEITTAETK